jgi:hypothetical protein
LSVLNGDSLSAVKLYLLPAGPLNLSNEDSGLLIAQDHFLAVVEDVLKSLSSSSFENPPSLQRNQSDISC